MLPRWIAVVAWVTLLLLVDLSETFFVGVVDASVEEADGYEVFHPLDSWILGGATGIVYNALTFNIFGIKEKIRKIYELVASYAIFEGLGLITTVIANVIAAVAVSVSEILTIIVSNIIETGYRKKLAFAEFLFRVATGRSLEGVVELARRLGDMDDPISVSVSG